MCMMTTKVENIAVLLDGIIFSDMEVEMREENFVLHMEKSQGRKIIVIICGKF